MYRDVESFWQAAPPAKLANLNGERPSKRQRIELDMEIPPSEQKLSDYAVLCKKEFHLVSALCEVPQRRLIRICPRTMTMTHEKSAENAAHLERVEVMVESIQRSEKSHELLDVTVRTENGLRLVFLKQVLSREQERFLLNARVQLSYQHSYHELQSRVSIRQCCTLEANLRGTSLVAELVVRILWKSGVPGLYDMDRKALSFWKDNVATWKLANRSAVSTSEVFADTSTGPNAREPSPHDFYEYAHIPDSTELPDFTLQPSEIVTKLYPFQLRTVQWLLQREGVPTDAQKRARHEMIAADRYTVPYVEMMDADERRFLVSNMLYQAIKVEDRTDMITATLPVGGILAEEMGLGKTVELIALMCLHRRPATCSLRIHDDCTNKDVHVSKATLIITPASILEQWKSELKKHAPGLKVLIYKGMSKNNQRDNFNSMSEETVINSLLEQDVVLATYGTVGSEIHYAAEKRDRGLRHAKVYKTRSSPLVEISWWRVCLDEAQMVESGVSNAAKVAQRIPRINAWAVTGTPVRKDVQDLYGLLLFLRFEPFCNETVWQRTCRDRLVFSSIFARIAIRHTKAKIPELQLPPQRRIVITVPFTAIEDHYYCQLFQEMCDECGLDEEGGPLLDSWDPNDARTLESMRRWLTRLRQACMHPELGDARMRHRALAFGRKVGSIRTVDEVLDVMIRQNKTTLRSEERAMLQTKILQGHILSFGKQSKSALAVYKDALSRSDVMVKECREEVTTAETKHAKEFSLHLQAWKENKGKAEDEPQLALATEEKARLRVALEIQHTCLFFMATAYFQIKSDSLSIEDNSQVYNEIETLESQHYDRAKSVRHEILDPVISYTRALMRKVEICKQDPVMIPIIPLSTITKGIESRRVKDKFNAIAQHLNRQRDQLMSWRELLMKLLLAGLVDQDEDVELTGEEYEASTKDQDRQYVYLFALRIAIADRTTLMTGQSNQLIDHEIKEALKMANDNEGNDPELTRAVIKAARDLRLEPEAQQTQSFKALIEELRNLTTAVRWQQNDRSNRSEIEAVLLDDELGNARDILKSQTEANIALDRELDLFRTTQNSRLVFYKQLQQISDTVKPLQEEMDDSVNQIKLAEQRKREHDHAAKLSTLQTTRRFLTHLQSESGRKEDQRLCVICQGHFVFGVLTICGHLYCKDCITRWWSENKSCPMCKRHLKLTEFHDVTYKPAELTAVEERSTSSTKPGPNSTAGIYSSISKTVLDEIQGIELRNSFGTKIDTMGRHLLWIRDNDPGAKTIIFSQYSEFLRVFARSLGTLNIGYAEMRDPRGITRFKDDPAVECFLLHAKADSSGLNLVNATHVFLCEPLINVALELQAIARVHRIGQQRATSVWMYLVGGTVEEAIYDISVSRRMAHMQRTTPCKHDRNGKHSDVGSPAETNSAFEEGRLEAANSLELQAIPLSKLLTRGGSDGEIVQTSDIWSCLFSKSKKVQYVSASREMKEATSGEMELT